MRRKVWNTGRNFDSFFSTASEGLRKVRTGRLAFYCEKSTAWAVIPNLFEPHEICDTREIYFRKKDPFGIIVKKQSPFRERLLINYIRMLEVGVMHKIWNFWNPRKPPCTSQGHFESVRLEYSTSCFLILFLAFLVSVGVLLIEISIVRYKQRNNKT